MWKRLGCFGGEGEGRGKFFEVVFCFNKAIDLFLSTFFVLVDVDENAPTGLFSFLPVPPVKANPRLLRRGSRSKTGPQFQQTAFLFLSFFTHTTKPESSSSSSSQKNLLSLSCSLFSKRRPAT